MCSGAPPDAVPVVAPRHRRTPAVGLHLLPELRRPDRASSVKDAWVLAFGDDHPTMNRIAFGEELSVFLPSDGSRPVVEQPSGAVQERQPHWPDQDRPVVLLRRGG